MATETTAMNRCPTHGMYAAASPMVACPKCEQERTVVAGKRGGKLAEQAVRVREIIRRGRRTFIEVGDALMVMRDQKLYRQWHGTFQDFCEAEGLSRSYAYRQISAAKVAGNVANGDKLNEAQARELAPVLKRDGAEGVREVMAEAGPTPTARGVRKAVQQRLGSGEVEQPCAHPHYKCIDCGKVLS